MSNHKTEKFEEEKKESLIEENEELLQEIHADLYMGTDDDMPDNFNSWLEDLSLEDLEEYLSKADKVISSKTNYPKEISLTEDQCEMIKWAFGVSLEDRPHAAPVSAWSKSMMISIVNQLDK